MYYDNIERKQVCRPGQCAFILLLGPVGSFPPQPSSEYLQAASLRAVGHFALDLPALKGYGCRNASARKTSLKQPSKRKLAPEVFSPRGELSE